jgi:hypothetical protein
MRAEAVGREARQQTTVRPLYALTSVRSLGLPSGRFVPVERLRLETVSPMSAADQIARPATSLIVGQLIDGWRVALAPSAA